MYKKVLCLTPECSKLWAIRPGLGFLYKSIIMDGKDYEGILSEADDGTYNFLVAKNVERFRMEGILQVKNYTTLLIYEQRKSIHESASQYVDLLDEKKQVDLTIQSHKDYRDYLKAQILFCQTNEHQFVKLSKRLASIEKRLKSVIAAPEMNDELVESLKRIAAKSLAGACVVSQFEGAHLFDTSEYRPFITGMSMDDFVYHDEVETRAVDILAAIILNKNLPDITVYDDYTMTEFLKARNELDILHSILNEIIEQYYEILKADPQLAKEHLHNQFNAAKKKLDSSLLPIQKRSNIMWKTTEILGTLQLPLVSSLLQPLKEKNIKEYKAKKLKELKEENELIANLIFVFDEVQHGNKALGIEIKKTWKEPSGDNIIWGQQGAGLPWYERE